MKLNISLISWDLFNPISRVTSKAKALHENQCNKFYYFKHTPSKKQKHKQKQTNKHTSVFTSVHESIKLEDENSKTTKKTHNILRILQKAHSISK